MTYPTNLPSRAIISSNSPLGAPAKYVPGLGLSRFDSTDTPSDTKKIRTICRPLIARIGAALLAALAPAFAQSPATAPTEAPTTLATDATPTLHVSSSLVAVSAIVRDAAGAPVSNLTRGSFVLKQDNKPQPITYFSQGSNLPLTLALMVDTSGSQRFYIRDEVAAGKAFFPAMLTQSSDRAIVIQFDDRILKLLSFTTSTTALENSLAYLTRSHNDIGVGGHGGTLLFDAISGVSHLDFGAQLSRRAMVILTDGGDNGSEVSSKDAIRAAQAADIMVYTIYYSNGGGDEDVLKKISAATGGREFAVTPDLTLAQIYATIAADLRQSYELGYAPPDKRPNKYHKIDLRTTDKKLTVQSREGYFTPK